MSKMSNSHDKYLNGRELWKSVIALNHANGVTFVDQLSITVILPAVTRHFTGSGIIEFSSVAQLIAATGGQAILGYLSNVWSRRTMLLFAQAISLLSSLLCMASFWIPSAGAFVFFRVLAGAAIGSISNLVNIAQSDFSPPRRRQTLQGVQGLSVACGSTIGVLVGAVFTRTSQSYYWLYLIQAGLAALSLFCTYKCVPANKEPPQRSEWVSVMKEIDYPGILSGLGSVIFGLLLLCKFDSLSIEKKISFTVLCMVCLVIFILLGIKRVRHRIGLQKIRPIVPFKLFKNRTIFIIYLQNVLLGATYFGFLFSMPVSLRLIQFRSALQASSYMIPYFVVHGIWSAASAYIIRSLIDQGRKSYQPMFLFGFAAWAVMMGLLGWNSTNPHGAAVTIVLAALVGFGTGSSFQNSVNAINSQVSSAERATAIGTRNILRYFGGAIGAAIVQALQNQKIAQLPMELQGIAKKAVFNLELKGLTDVDQAMVLGKYSDAVALVYYIMAGMMGLCFVLSFLIKDEGGKKSEENEKPEDRGQTGGYEEISRNTSSSTLAEEEREEETSRNISSSTLAEEEKEDDPEMGYERSHRDRGGSEAS